MQQSILVRIILIGSTIIILFSTILQTTTVLVAVVTVTVAVVTVTVAVSVTGYYPNHYHHQYHNNPYYQLHQYYTTIPRRSFITTTTTRSSSSIRITTRITIISMKAWTCHGRNQHDMVQRLQQAGIIRNDAVARVMSCIDRKHYFPSTTITTTTTTNTQQQQQYSYYDDTPNSIGYGQTISAPHMHAYVLEEIISHIQQQQQQINVSSSFHNNNNNNSTINSTTTNNATTTTTTTPIPRMMKFLDVGCGSGYITACFGRWLQPQRIRNTNNTNDNDTTSSSTTSTIGSLLGPDIYGYAYGIDIIPELVQLSYTNIMKQDSDLLVAPQVVPQVVPATNTTNTNTTNSATITLQIGNGYYGLQQYAPYDIIHVGAASIQFPIALCQQLKVGGLLIIPLHDTVMNSTTSSSSSTMNNNNNTSTSIGTTNSQTLYKIERLYDSATTTSNNKDGITTTVPTTTTTSSSSSLSSSFNRNEYRITPLLGVRYVPLVQPPL